jgi:hypothetical protein
MMFFLGMSILTMLTMLSSNQLVLAVLPVSTRSKSPNYKRGMCNAV